MVRLKGGREYSTAGEIHKTVRGGLGGDVLSYVLSNGVAAQVCYVWAINGQG